MPHSRSQNSPDGRPDFMVLLGLGPPYALEDVKAAYLDKAKEMHPDHGGSPEEFDALHKAYEQAQQYLDFRSDRRGWIANQMQGYLGVQEVIEKLEDFFGAEVTSDAIDWLKKSFGDFAQLTENIVSIHLEGSDKADEMIRYMVEHASELGSLHQLDLPNCKVSDQAVLELEVFQQLQHLDLSGTPVTKDATWIVDAILGLESLELRGTRVGWWMKRKVRSVLQQRIEARPLAPLVQG
ncbi:MAG: hypothetical protein MI725_16630 [Pirellulales bacterium]|nr:hypothetical protein [Pirellulales bacterium]